MFGSIIHMYPLNDSEVVGGESTHGACRIWMLTFKPAEYRVGGSMNSKNHRCYPQHHNRRNPEPGSSTILQYLANLRNFRNPEPGSNTIQYIGNLRNPEPRSNTNLANPEPATAPSRPGSPRATPKPILGRDLIAFCCWGKTCSLPTPPHSPPLACLACLETPRHQQRPHQPQLLKKCRRVHFKKIVMHYHLSYIIMCSCY